ncbi:adenosylcobinamide-phosphate synthase CbiB [Phenylobacterium aquaticum]|uniref:adenosylcobinamide-phosphate synthase CbiB n=1 Tax=Phenylobacterium aquaticum TaxID=1763816 RepID=UPI0026EA5F81|nr:adenosylcobinamide-phosphate synthase CbiB [Phenylobacterium aquaticum]
MPADPWIVLGAALIEGATGYPDRLHARLPHPISWAGWLIGALERGLNRGRARRAKGVLALAIVAGLAGFLGWAVQGVLAGSWTGLLVTAAVGSLGLAARSLYDHVRPVLKALEADDLPAARTAVARIVGRDVQALDASGVAAAALESLAESLTDGVVAPLFWFLLAGLPGLFVYKAVNTADSLIGHREEPYRLFGWAAARTDDLMNLIPARLAGPLIVLVGGRGWRVMRRDADRHASPNAGWTEAAMAGALAIELGGDATYDGVRHHRPIFGDGHRPQAADLKAGLRLYRRACIVLASALLVGGFAWPR